MGMSMGRWTLEMDHPSMPISWAQATIIVSLLLRLQRPTDEFCWSI